MAGAFRLEPCSECCSPSPVCPCGNCAEGDGPETFLVTISGTVHIGWDMFFNDCGGVPSDPANCNANGVWEVSCGGIVSPCNYSLLVPTGVACNLDSILIAIVDPTNTVIPGVGYRIVVDVYVKTTQLIGGSWILSPSRFIKSYGDDKPNCKSLIAEDIPAYSLGSWPPCSFASATVSLTSGT